MDKAKVAGLSPIPVNVNQGEKYAWCSCGLSSNQPLCDGSHKGSAFTPKVFTAEETKTVYLCTCKATNNPGFCDGTHKSLPKE